MRRFKFAKLVRDKIVPDIIEVGNVPNYRILQDQEYLNELKKKLIEETTEILNSNQDDLLKELADIQEIIDCLLEALNISKGEIDLIKEKKKEKWGSFKKRFFIDSVDAEENSEYTKYYLSEPDKYPEDANLS